MWEEKGKSLYEVCTSCNTADLDLEDDSEEEIIQPPTHQKVKVTKAVSAATKITTQLNKAK